jgi:hypothetical protein
MPWYGATDLPGFRAVIPTRPEGVLLDTDLLVEVVDGRGEVTVLDHLFLKWHPRRRISYANWNEQRLPALLRTVKVGDAEAAKIRGGDIDPLIDAVLAANPNVRDDDFIRATYRVLLGRQAEDEAMEFYLTRMGRGGTRRDVVEGILASKEFKGAYLAK